MSGQLLQYLRETTLEVPGSGLSERQVATSRPKDESSGQASSKGRQAAIRPGLRREHIWMGSGARWDWSVAPVLKAG